MTWHNGRTWQLAHIDLRSGERRTLGTTFGEIPAWTQDASPRRALVLDRESGSLWSVTLDGTARSLISDPSHGTGAAFNSACDLAYDATLDAAYAYVLDWQQNSEPARMVRVELATGNRSVVSGGATGTGPQFIQPYGFALDPVHNRAIVADRGNGQLLVVVDLASGERRSLGAFADSYAEWRVAYDTVQQRAVVAGPQQPVWSIDVANGQRSRLGSADASSTLELVSGLAVWPGRSVALLNVGDQLVAIDLREGDRVILSR